MAARLVSAGVGIALAVGGFTVALAQVYRYPFTSEFRAELLRWLICGSIFLVGGRLLRVYGGAVLLLLLLLLFAGVWAYAEIAQGISGW
jgi:hypothetical protein